MNTKGKSQIRDRLENSSTRHKVFEELLKPSSTHLSKEDQYKDFLRNHSFFFTKSYTKELKSKIIRIQAEFQGRLA